MDHQAIFQRVTNTGCEPEAISRSLGRVRGVYRGPRYGNGAFNGWDANGDRSRPADYAHRECLGERESTANRLHGGTERAFKHGAKIRRCDAASADSLVFAGRIRGRNTALCTGA